MSKITRSLARISERLDPSTGLYQLPDPKADVLSLGGIAIASGCYYLDKRFADVFDWRAGQGAALAAWFAEIEKRPSWRNSEN